MDPWNDHDFPLHQGMTFGSHRIESSSLSKPGKPRIKHDAICEGSG
jgi:hypothetical protein